MAEKQQKKQKVKDPEKGKKIRKIILRVLLIVLIVAVVGIAGYVGYTTLKAKYTHTYTASTVRNGTISDTLSYSGKMKVVSSETVTATASGTVRTLYVAAGDVVSKGQKLVKLSDSEIVYASIAGTVMSVSVEEGDTVRAGDTLLVTADLTRMKVSFSVDEYSISKVYPGKECTVTMTASGETFNTTVSTVNYVSNGGSIAYYTAVVEANTQGTVYPGMQCTVEIVQTEAENVPVLSKDALSFDEENSAFVYTLQEDGTMQKTPVTLGAMNDDYVEITSGVTVGTTIYTEVVQETSAASSLFSLFGGMGGGMGGGGSMPSMGDGNMPDMSSFGDSDRSFGPGSSDRSSGSSSDRSSSDRSSGGFSGGGPGGF